MRDAGAGVLGVEFLAVHFDQRRRPIHRRRDGRIAAEFLLPQILHQRVEAFGQPARDAGRARFKNFRLARGVGIIDPMIDAAPLEGVVNFTRAVAGDHDDRPRRRPDGAELRHADLKIRENLQRIRLEALIRPVDFVDQQNRGTGGAGLQCLENGALDEKAPRKNIGGDGVPAALPVMFGEADFYHLSGVIPLIDGGRSVQPFVTLQAQERALQLARQGDGELALADTALAFQQKRAAELEAQEQRRRQAAVGDIVAAPQQRAHVFNRIRCFP